MNLINSKKSQSQIITTILLILIAISLIVIISGFAINFVNSKLSESNCFDVTDDIYFTNKIQYTCYNETYDFMTVQIHIGDLTDPIQGFRITADVAGSSESFEVKNNTNEGSVSMYAPLPSPYDGKILIPGQNSERTYKLDVTNKPDSLAIYPILEDGKTCDASDNLVTVVYCT